MNSFRWDAFDRVPIVGILRGLDPARLPALLRAALQGGLTTVEITMNSPGAAAQIRAAVALAGGTVNVGAGTVLSLNDLHTALEAGAMFIVTPTLQRTVILECVRRGIPVFPGALSTGEILHAADLGARLVKIFPADHLGPDYIRRIKALAPDIGLLPTGGVDLATLPAFADAGADGFGIGSPLFDRTRIDAGDWAWLEQRCRAFVAAWESVRDRRIKPVR